MEAAEEDDDSKKEEYLALYAIFQKFLEAHGDEERWELLESLMSLRAEFAIHHALKGFDNMDIEKALELLRGHNKGLTKLEKEQRDVLVAAIDNLIDFAVAEEFQMANNLPKNFDVDNIEDYEECEELFWKYNDLYAGVENKDIEFAMHIAAWWVVRNEFTMLTYMTQGDSRVRPWHAALEGLRFPKKDFPDWLIPPIEHGCRCFLVEDGDVVVGESKVAQVEDATLQMPDFVNPVFRESVAKGGRIFSSAHSYFTIPKGYKRKLKKISKKLKEQWELK